MMGNYHVRFGGRERRVLIEARPSRPNAEIGAAFVCARLGVAGEHIDDHAAYVGSWLKALRNDKRLIFKAAAQAQAAADRVLAHAGDADRLGTPADVPAPIAAAPIAAQSAQLALL